MMEVISIMIEFNGKLTRNAKKFFYRKIVCMAIFEMLIGSLMGSLTTIIAWYLYFNIFEIYSLLVGTCVIVISSLLPCAMFFSKRIVPQKVTIKGESIISQTGYRTKTISINDIKKIYDYGDYYYIVAVFLKHSPVFICQKDLLSKGTIDEFKKLFSGKIISVRQGTRKTGDGSVSSDELS